MDVFRPRRYWRLGVWWAVPLLVAAACSAGDSDTSGASDTRDISETSRTHETGGESDDDEANSSLTLISRPILDIVPAASIGANGQPVDPAFVFGRSSEQITIVVAVGDVTDDVAGSPLDITWSQVTDEGEQVLFTHAVDVASFDVAYSIGVSPGVLASGPYHVRATLEGETQSTQFEVQSPEGAVGFASSAESGPPSSGDSGVVGPPAPFEHDTSVITVVHHDPEDPAADSVVIIVLASIRGGGGRVEVKATMNGSTRTRSFPSDDLGHLYRSLEFRPCFHPGGSDLPGANLSFESIAYEGDTRMDSRVDLVTLGPDDSRPAVTLNITPRSGSRVEPGDEILFDVTAQEARTGLSWQTGLRELRVRAIPGEDLVPQERADSDRAQPCASKQWSLATQGSYTVPDDPPATFRICPLAIDFAGNQNGDTCATYFTGDDWEGTYGGTVTWDCASYGRRSGTLSGTFTISVDDDGQATMDAVNTVTGNCTGPEGSADSPFVETGERTRSGFSFPAFFTTPSPLTIEVSGDQGTGSFEGSTADNALISLTFEIHRP